MKPSVKIILSLVCVIMLLMTAGCLVEARGGHYHHYGHTEVEVIGPVVPVPVPVPVPR